MTKFNDPEPNVLVLTSRQPIDMSRHVAETGNQIMGNQTVVAETVKSNMNESLVAEAANRTIPMSNVTTARNITKKASHEAQLVANNIKGDQISQEEMKHNTNETKRTSIDTSRSVTEIGNKSIHKSNATTGFKKTVEVENKAKGDKMKPANDLMKTLHHLRTELPEPINNTKEFFSNVSRILNQPWKHNINNTSNFRYGPMRCRLSTLTYIESIL